MAKRNIDEQVKTIKDLQKIWDDILNDIQSYYNGNSDNLNLNELIEDFIHYFVLYETRINVKESTDTEVKKLFDAINTGVDEFQQLSISLFKEFDKQPDRKLSNINQDFFTKVSTYKFSYEKSTFIPSQLNLIQSKIAIFLLVYMEDIIINIDNENKKHNIFSNLQSKISFYSNNSLNFTGISSLCEAYPSARLDGFDPKNIDVSDDSKMIQMLNQTKTIMFTILTSSPEISHDDNKALKNILINLYSYNYLSTIYKENILEITNLSLKYFTYTDALKNNPVLLLMLNTISNYDTQNMTIDRQLQFLEIKIRFMDMIEANTISVSPEMQQALIKSTLTTVGQVLAHESFVSSNADIQAYKEIFTAFNTDTPNQSSLNQIEAINKNLQDLNKPSLITRVLMKICSWFISQKTIDKHNIQVNSMATITQVLQASEKLLSNSNSIPTQNKDINNSQTNNLNNITKQVSPTNNEEKTLSY